MKIVKKIYPNFKYEYSQYINRGTLSVEISKEISNLYIFRLSDDGPSAYFLSFEGSNDILFKHLGISDDRKSYMVKHLFGHHYGGQWPYAKTEEQCLVLLDYLYKNQEKIVKGLDDYK